VPLPLRPARLDTRLTSHSVLRRAGHCSYPDPCVHRRRREIRWIRGGSLPTVCSATTLSMSTCNPWRGCPGSGRRATGAERRKRDHRRRSQAPFSNNGGSSSSSDAHSPAPWRSSSRGAVLPPRWSRWKPWLAVDRQKVVHSKVLITSGGVRSGEAKPRQPWPKSSAICWDYSPCSRTRRRSQIWLVALMCSARGDRPNPNRRDDSSICGARQSAV
jgi:hypothetical protein